MTVSGTRKFLGLLAAAGVLATGLAACGGESDFPPAPPEAAAVVNPIPDTPEIREEGRKIYLSSCATCHGFAGDGFGPQYQLFFPRPTDFGTEIFQAQTDGAIFWKTLNGNPLNEDVNPDDHRLNIENDEQIWTIIRALRDAPTW